ncbi:5-fold beta-flower protein [Streptomyces sp. NPDC005236]|uniref:5-fold beta-flower protein n=1 Tax=Streptomyces sp. NPDC005236 TaxID=3157028 RepID=UPI0033BDD6D5
MGTIYSPSGHLMGSVESDGTVTNSQGRTLGRVSTYDVYENDAKRVGEVEYSGFVLDSRRLPVGYVRDTSVYANDDHLVGTVDAEDDEPDWRRKGPTNAERAGGALLLLLRERPFPRSA